MRIAHFADLHFGREDRSALEAATALVREAGVDALVISGDLTQRGKQEEFEKALNWVDSFQLPAICVPGNHDTPLLNLPARAAAPFARFSRYFDHKMRPLRFQGVCVHGLNTARGWQARMNWAEGSVNLDELGRVIADDHDGLRLIACHHPFQSPAKARLTTATRRGERASRSLAASPVSVLLTGHVHTPHAEVIRKEEGAYLAITAGTLSTRLRTKPPSFNFISVRESALELSVQAFVDGTFSEAATGHWDLGSLEPVGTPAVLVPPGKRETSDA